MGCQGAVRATLGTAGRADGLYMTNQHVEAWFLQLATSDTPCMNRMYVVNPRDIFIFQTAKAATEVTAHQAYNRQTQRLQCPSRIPRIQQTNQLIEHKVPHVGYRKNQQTRPNKVNPNQSIHPSQYSSLVQKKKEKKKEKTWRAYAQL